MEDDDAEGTLKSHKSQTKEAQVTRPAAPPAPPRCLARASLGGREIWKSCNDVAAALPGRL